MPKLIKTPAGSGEVPVELPVLKGTMKQECNIYKYNNTKIPTVV